MPWSTRTPTAPHANYKTPFLLVLNRDFCSIVPHGWMASIGEEMAHKVKHRPVGWASRRP